MGRTFAPRTLDHRIADLATAQHGPVHREQLLALGVTESAIDHRVARGTLHALFEGVYLPGHRALSRHGRYMGAVLACGPTAALSHRSGADLLGVRRDESADIDVSITTRSRRERPGIRIHRPRTLAADEVMQVAGIPVTTPARTLLDLAEVLNRRQLERACDEAERGRVVDWADVRGLVDVHPHKLGARRMRRLMESYAIGEDASRSELERRLMAFCDLHRLPRPSREVTVLGITVDFCWPEERVIVETDGWEYHRTRIRFEDDRRRDAALVAAGWRVIRITKARLAGDRRVLLRELRALLAAGGATQAP